MPGKYQVQKNLEFMFQSNIWYKDSYKNQEKRDSVINGEEEELPVI